MSGAKVKGETKLLLHFQFISEVVECISSCVSEPSCHFSTLRCATYMPCQASRQQERVLVFLVGCFTICPGAGTWYDVLDQVVIMFWEIHNLLSTAKAQRLIVYIHCLWFTLYLLS